MRHGPPRLRQHDIRAPEAAGKAFCPSRNSTGSRDTHTIPVSPSDTHAPRAPGPLGRGKSGSSAITRASFVRETWPHGSHQSSSSPRDPELPLVQAVEVGLDPFPGQEALPFPGGSELRRGAAGDERGRLTVRRDVHVLLVLRCAMAATATRQQKVLDR